MFKTIKEKVDIKEIIAKETELECTSIGEGTFELEDKTCPFCGHKDCFRIKDTGDDNAFYHCFSCEEHGDLITFVAKARELSPREAVLALAKEYNIQLPNDYSPVQEIFTLTANYYHQCMMETCNKSYSELNKLTPLEYQTQIRKHSEESIRHFKIGWSDGELISCLRALGFETEILIQAGLINKKGGDFLPARAFIYPHYVRGKVSHFTFKDPLKQVDYQLKTKNKLNGHDFYGQDSIQDSDAVIIVEGENDLISVYEAGWKGGILATIGQISTAQLQWIDRSLKDYRVITIFDNDHAGAKYRDKISHIKRKFKSLAQVKLSGVKDIDEYLKAGGSLEGLLSSIETWESKVEPESTQEETVEQAGPEIIVEEGETEETLKRINVIEKNGAYYKLRFKDGETIPIQLTNFIIQLTNVYVKENKRERECVVVREDGIKSEPVIVDSEVKVSLKPFKAFIANVIDASFYGSEADLTAIWEYVYAHGIEKIVHVPMAVGRVEEVGGWLFRDLFITSSGAVIRPDNDGIVWLPGNMVGVRATSLDSQTIGRGKGSFIDVPKLDSEGNVEERTEILKEVITNLSTNLGDPGMALTLLGWAKASAFSDIMFPKVQGFPFLFLWGKHGKGKTVIAKWIAAMYNTDESGYSTLPQYKSGVGFGRMIAYYASLPVIMDEIRADTSAKEQYGTFRSWYQRAGRMLGTKEGKGVKVQPVRSNFIFVGQDQFDDTATKQRCICYRIPVSNREPVITYRWMETKRSEQKLSALGYHWILESTRADIKELFEEYEKIDKALVNNGMETRQAKNWACVGVFAKQLANQFMPEFDYEKYLLMYTKLDAIEQDEDDIVAQFFTTIEAMQIAERSRLNNDHIRKDGKKLIIWAEAVYKEVQQERHDRSKEHFSYKALREALREESYFVKDDRAEMGATNTRRRVVILDLDKAPDSIKNIAEIANA